MLQANTGPYVMSRGVFTRQFTKCECTCVLGATLNALEDDKNNECLSSCIFFGKNVCIVPRMLVKRRKFNQFSYNYPTGITVDFIHTKKTMLIPATFFVSASSCTTDVAEIAKICGVTTCRCSAAIYSIEMQICM